MNKILGWWPVFTFLTLGAIWFISWCFGIDKTVEANTSNYYVTKSLVELMQIDISRIPVIQNDVAHTREDVNRIEDKVDMLLRNAVVQNQALKKER